ncbi:MAG TPA: tripartite tricarboxylate transporter TctB family protein [Candidatus Binatia bacterium]|nr:tripartite tricarboxylate transporter TctB family protein [Candidatus Binatia bacterium]
MTADRIAGGALVLFSLLVIWQSGALPLGTFRHPGPAYIPVLLALLLLFFGALLAATSRHAPKLSAIQWPESRHAAAILGACTFAGFGLDRFGYRVTVVLALLFLLKIVERRGWLLSVSLSLALAFGSFHLFHTLLRVPLPQGPLGF